MHIVFVASTPFRHLHHRSQRLAKAFRALGVPVTYVEQTYGWRAYLKRDRRQLLRAMGRAARYHLQAAAVVGPRVQEPDGGADMRIVELPLVVPMTRINSAWVERMNARVFRSVLKSEVFPALAGEETVALVDNPMWSMALRRGDFSRMFYDCIDDISLYAGRSTLARFRAYERDLLEKVDGVFVTARGLEELLRAASPGKRIVRIPNGVDPEWFEAQAGAGVPEDIAGLKRPIVGYIGNIADWLAYESVAATAAALPHVTFLFVGPVDFRSRLTRLRAPNIILVGRKPYEQVPRYIAACNACWIPFSTGPLVENTNPIKLFEYFALGKPVVTTPLPEAEEFARDGLVYVGDNTEKLVKAVESALREDSQALANARRFVAQHHAWAGLARQMLTELEKGAA